MGYTPVVKDAVRVASCCVGVVPMFELRRVLGVELSHKFDVPFSSDTMVNVYVPFAGTEKNPVK